MIGAGSAQLLALNHRPLVTRPAWKMLRPADTSQWNESGWKLAFRAVGFLISRPWMVASRSTRLPINARSLLRGYRLILAGWPLGLLQGAIIPDTGTTCGLGQTHLH